MQNNCLTSECTYPFGVCLVYENSLRYEVP